MATLAAPPPAAPPAPVHWSQRLPKQALDHIPGEDGLPVIGTTLRVLRDPPAYGRHMIETYGRVFRTNSFGIRNVNLVGADANELVLFDRDKIFSSDGGWSPVLHRLFPRGLMLLDFDKHRADRRALSVAFKPEPMRHYAGSLNRAIGEAVEGWAGPMRFYPAIKQLTLELAADSFIGLPFGPEAARINQAFVDMVQASVAPIRTPLPGTLMKRGVDGRAFLVEYFTAEAQRRREAGGGQDMFSQFATATDESGALLPIDEVVDHMNFLMMAAHDTITSSATSLVYLLARHPEWQSRVRDELLGVVGTPGAPLQYDDLGKPELTEMAFKEALRLIPPVPSLPRRALRAFEFAGYHIPAGTPVSISPASVHMLPEHWPDPTRFDPERFTADKVKARHKYAWVPFGGGAHMCLGLHFAYMQIKILMAHLLTRYRLEIDAGYDPKWQAWPIPQPKDGLRVTLKPL